MRCYAISSKDRTVASHILKIASLVDVKMVCEVIGEELMHDWDVFCVAEPAWYYVPISIHLSAPRGVPPELSFYSASVVWNFQGGSIRRPVWCQERDYPTTGAWQHPAGFYLPPDHRNCSHPGMLMDEQFLFWIWTWKINLLIRLHTYALTTFQ